MPINHPVTGGARRTGQLLLLCLCCYATGISAADSAAGAGQPTQPDNRYQQEFEARSRNINTLLIAFRSVADETGNASRISQLEHAVGEKMVQAKEQYSRHNHAAAGELMDQAYASVKTAIITIRNGETLTRNRPADEQYEIHAGKPKGLQDYQTRVASIKALLDAYQRVAEEKGQQLWAAEVTGSISGIIDRAEVQFKAGEYSNGVTLLADAYTLVKEALAALREGETLVRTLNFASQAEEYQYYLIKTDSQMRAIRMLQQIDTRSSDSTQIARVLSQSQALLDQASTLAGENRFQDAIPIMDRLLTRLQFGLMMVLSAR